MTQIERECRTSIVAAHAHWWAAQHASVYMCAPFWAYARALGILGGKEQPMP